MDHYEEKEARKRNHETRKLLTRSLKDGDFNVFLTVAFATPTGWIGPRVRLFRDDIESGKGMIETFSKHVSDKMFGRSRNNSARSRPTVPIIAVPEYKDKHGDPTFLHYHCMITCQRESIGKLTSISHLFWNKICSKNYKSSFDIRVDKITPNTLDSVIYYTLKNLDDDFTIQHTVTTGL